MQTTRNGCGSVHMTDYLWLCRRVEGGADKTAIMMRLMQHLQRSSPQQAGKQTAEGFAVYIGDSPSDFGSMLQADLGIVVGQNKLLRRVAHAHAVKIKPLIAGATLTGNCLLLCCAYSGACVCVASTLRCTNGLVYASVFVYVLMVVCLLL